MKNAGVGPVVIEWFEVRYKGTAYGPSALLRACCAASLQPGSQPGVAYSNLSQNILPAREHVEVLSLTGNANSALLDAVGKARPEMTFQACYCSVLQECWQTNFSTTRPQPIKDCQAPAHTTFCNGRKATRYFFTRG